MTLTLFLSILEDFATQSLNYLKQPNPHRGGFDLSDTEKYKYEVVFTTLRSLLVPIYVLTNWIESTNTYRIDRDIGDLCNKIIYYYNEGTLTDQIKIFCTTCLNPYILNRRIIKEFFSGSLLKVIKQYEHDVISLRQGADKHRRACRLFYSFNQLKCGIATLPNTEVFDKMKKWKEEISTPERITILLRSIIKNYTRISDLWNVDINKNDS